MDQAQDQLNGTLRIPVIWMCITPIILSIGFGFFLGLNHLIEERIKEGKWQVNLSKLIIIGIPSLIFGHAFYLIFLFHISLGRFGSFLVTKPSTYMILFRVLLGYVVATSFYKESSVGKADVTE